MLGEQVVPVLRREFAALKPAHVPEAPRPPARRGRAGRAGDGVDPAAGARTRREPAVAVPA